MQFLGNFGKIVCLRPPGESAPPPRGNPGSATALFDISSLTHCLLPIAVMVYWALCLQEGNTWIHDQALHELGFKFKTHVSSSIGSIMSIGQSLFDIQKYN